jgi:FMN hydrolase / 5-amino-6-(5-phospho-D-ribitylamino)uracil phosphatase
MPAVPSSEPSAEAPAGAAAVLARPLDTSRIRAISIDLDDTLWPIWPTIERAEAVLLQWLTEHAPATATLFSSTESLRAIRNQMVALRPDLVHDLSALRRESIRLALTQAGDEPDLAEPAFDLFFAERQRVELFADAHDTLAFLAARYPVVALSNGNADVHRIGIGHYFKASISATAFGIAKPDARIFHAAASAAQVQPHEVLHVGDDAALDVQGALAAGMQAIWLNTPNHPWAHDQHGEPPHATVASLTAIRELLKAIPEALAQPPR